MKCLYEYIDLNMCNIFCAKLILANMWILEYRYQYNIDICTVVMDMCYNGMDMCNNGMDICSNGMDMCNNGMNM